MDYNPAIQLIKKSRSIGIAVYEKGGGDEIGSALAMASILKKQGKTAGFLFSGIIEDKWKTLFTAPGPLPKAEAQNNDLKLRDFIIAVNSKESPVGEIKYEMKQNNELFIILSPQKTSIKKEHIRFIEDAPSYDCLISIGVESPEHFGKEFEENPLLFYEKPIINIDTSPKNEHFGEINLIYITKNSNAEIAYELFDNLAGEKIGPLEATRILAGIIEKTDNFKNHKTTPRVLEIASFLMEAGADKESIIKILYKTRPLNLLQLWGRASVRSRFDAQTGILWTFLPKDDFEKTGTKTKDIHFVIEHMKEYFKSPKIHALLFENPRKNHVRAIIKSEPETIKEVAAKEPGEEKNGVLFLKNGFTSFPEAENYVDNILKRLET